MAESTGELQFTEKGVSGPVSFDISRTAAVLGEEAVLSVDFMRNYSHAQVKELLTRRRQSFPRLETAELFTGMLHNRLGRMLIKYARLNPAVPLERLTEADIEAAVSACKAFQLPLCGTEGFDKAQVTAGGIKTGGVDPQTMQSWFMPNLFVCGELLDVDGDCGGFNLQWAWASGRMAGRLGE